MSRKNNINANITPLPRVQTQLYYAVPCFLRVLGVHFLFPSFYKAGIPTLYAYSLGHGIPLVIMFSMAFAAFVIEGNL
jgi:hypothetical protein